MLITSRSTPAAPKAKESARSRPLRLPVKAMDGPVSVTPPTLATGAVGRMVTPATFAIGAAVVGARVVGATVVGGLVVGAGMAGVAGTS